ncbi:MAG: TolC family outer membrane protein [Magnetococcales bacterium]|nr:TolC family outer membrane protein [Magnetococcales bacterium]
MKFNLFFVSSSGVPGRHRGRWFPAMLLLASLFAPPCLAAPADTTPFEQAVASALDSNPKILAARATLAATKEKYEQSVAALLPDISFVASRTSYSDTWTDSNNGQSPDRFSVNLIQPLFRRPLLLALQQIKPLIEAADEEYNAALQSVLLESVQAVVNVLLTENMEKLAAENLVLSHRNLDAALKRRKAGDLTRTDVDQAASRVSTSEAELIRAKNDALVARARFEETVGMAVPAGLTIPNVPPSLLQGTLQDLIGRRSHRPDLRAAELRLASSDVSVDIERAGHLPMLDLQANALTFRGGTGASAEKISGEYQYSVAVQLTLPLFSGGKTLSKTREAMDTRDVRQADVQRVDKQAQREIQQAHLLVHSAKATVTSAESALQFSKEAVKGVEEEFAAGFRTVTQLFELQNQLFRAETDLAKNRYELISSQYQLLHTLGRLTTQDLQEGGLLSKEGGADLSSAESEDTNLFTRMIDALRRDPALDASPPVVLPGAKQEGSASSGSSGVPAGPQELHRQQQPRERLSPR